MALFQSPFGNPAWAPFRRIMPIPAVAPRVATALGERKPAKSSGRQTAVSKAAPRTVPNRKKRLSSDALFDRLPIS